jgi:AcrR family transcriptional regulator
MPRSPQTIEKLKEARRQQILRDSLRLFAINGYDATSINDIADSIGCSHGLIYHYFADKEAIFIALLDRSLELGYLPLFPQLDEEKLSNPEGTLRNIITHILEELVRPDSDFAYHFYLFLNMRFQKTVPLPRFQIPQKDQRPFWLIINLIKAGQALGRFALIDPKEGAVTFFATMRGLTYVKLHEGDRYVPPSADTLMNIFLRKA